MTDLKTSCECVCDACSVEGRCEECTCFPCNCSNCECNNESNHFNFFA